MQELERINLNAQTSQRRVVVVDDTISLKPQIQSQRLPDRFILANKPSIRQNRMPPQPASRNIRRVSLESDPRSIKLPPQRMGPPSLPSYMLAPQPQALMMGRRRPPHRLPDSIDYEPYGYREWQVLRDRDRMMKMPASLGPNENDDWKRKHDKMLRMQEY
ncbi:hypothetical protein BC829DRAFT_429234, partial [Chytridium lagenaria]